MIIIPNHDDDYEEETDPYSSDEFRMYEFKIRRCMRSRSHDWTDCPFAHPGEKARRRDPRRFHYSGNPCADFRRGTCPRGETCEFAHGVFECWLHPARYRTHACKDGKSCTRKVCFFAHTPRQLRVLPSSCCDSQCSSSPSISSPNHSCSFCHSMVSSPTSTLMGLSQLSPPLSPNSSPNGLRGNGNGGYSLLSRFNEASMLSPNSSFSSKTKRLSEYLSYKNALMELMSSLEAMDLNLVDSLTDYEDDHQQTQFFLSPTTTTATRVGGSSRDFFNDQDGLSSNGGPDLGWVNDLVM
ncbi:Zinc finger ccch domain-containing protein [Thalictrum thalictroides]|uniref:Zinc finger ccch domain-containing protein n=1 Tax=Thalictrum thalictroides TaxID=46969 RepID=A0A7J6VKS5_THATH|nr:Zinc finger ccch domain-containing protein [Thalictrum thalictroides]